MGWVKEGGRLWALFRLAQTQCSSGNCCITKIFFYCVDMSVTGSFNSAFCLVL